MKSVLQSWRIVAMVLCAMLAGCGPKLGPKESADRFFNLCAQGKAADAFGTAASEFRLERSPKYFQARVRELSLDHLQDVKWENVDKRGNAFVLTGAFTVAEQKEPVSMLVSMIEEKGEWRVLKVQRETPDGAGEDVFSVVPRTRDGERVRERGQFSDPVAPLVPTETQLRDLAEEALLKFDASVKAKDFTDFYNFVSDRWKYRGRDKRELDYVGNDPTRLKASDPNNTEGRITRAGLDREFRKFIDAQVDLSPVKGKAMILDEPATLSSEGILVLKGKFDTFVFRGEKPPVPQRMDFKLEFVLEGAKWKVFGITVNLYPEKKEQAANNGQ